MIDITIEATGLQARLAAFPVAFRAALRAALAVCGQIVSARADALIGPGGMLGVRTGNLKRAKFVGPVVDDGAAILEVRVGYDIAKAPQARILHNGGTILPKNAAHLAIPLPAMLTGNGVARGTARDVIADPGAFGFAGTFTARDVIFGTLGKTKSGRGKTRTMADTGEVRTSVPLFALKDSVTLPARPWLRTGLDQSRADILATLSRAFTEAAGA